MVCLSRTSGHEAELVGTLLPSVWLQYVSTSVNQYAMLPKLYKPQHHLSYHRISRISTSKKRCMAQKFKKQTHLIPPQSLIKKERSSSKRSRGCFFILRELLIWRCSLRSAHLHPNKRHLQKRQCKNAYNS